NQKPSIPDVFRQINVPIERKHLIQNFATTLRIRLIQIQITQHMFGYLPAVIPSLIVFELFDQPWKTRVWILTKPSRDRPRPGVIRTGHRYKQPFIRIKQLAHIKRTVAKSYFWPEKRP